MCFCFFVCCYCSLVLVYAFTAITVLLCCTWWERKYIGLYQYYLYYYQLLAETSQWSYSLCISNLGWYNFTDEPQSHTLAWQALWSDSASPQPMKKQQLLRQIHRLTADLPHVSHRSHSYTTVIHVYACIYCNCHCLKVMFAESWQLSAHSITQCLHWIAKGLRTKNY